MKTTNAKKEWPDRNGNRVVAGRGVTHFVAGVPTGGTAISVDGDGIVRVDCGDRLRLIPADQLVVDLPMGPVDLGQYGPERE